MNKWNIGRIWIFGDGGVVLPDVVTAAFKEITFQRYVYSRDGIIQPERIVSLALECSDQIFSFKKGE